MTARSALGVGPVIAPVYNYHAAAAAKAQRNDEVKEQEPEGDKRLAELGGQFFKQMLTIKAPPGFELPNGLISVFTDSAICDDPIFGRIFTISFLNNLKGRSQAKVEGQIKDGQICALHVENHQVSSLTVTAKHYQFLTTLKVKSIGFLVDDNCLIIGDISKVRTYKTQAQYDKFTSKIVETLKVQGIIF